MIVCIQCTMRAMIGGLPSPTFNETAAEHIRRCHPDPEAVRRERQELERWLTTILQVPLAERAP